MISMRSAVWMPRVRVAAYVALMACVAHSAAAQEARSGRLSGTVTDSIHARRPLAGVRVVAVGVESPEQIRGVATTDSAGAFRIDSLPPGRYMVGFESPLLDSLEVALPPRAVTVAAGESATVDLAMPSAAKLRAALCPGVALPPETGVVYGHVVNAETEGPLADVVVALQWRELALWDASSGKSLRPVHKDRSASVTTDADGWYRACGIPTGMWVSMQLQYEQRVGPVLRAEIDDSLGIAIRHLSLSPSATRDVDDSAATTPLTGTATLSGVVRGAGGLPVASAQVRVRGTASTAVTNAEGSYRLTGLPSGTHELDVRRIGYGVVDAPVDLRSGATTTRDIRLERVVSLDSVRVVAMHSRYPEFSEHRKFSLGGRFIGPEQMQRRHDARTSDIIRSIGGFRVENRGGRAMVVAARGASARRCVANVVIDGAVWGDDPDLASVDDVHPRDVGAIELYYGGNAPPEYDRGCGAVVIWTKR